jgi:hypothetical protein
MSTYLKVELRQQLLTADDHCCAYCQTTQGNSGSPMVVEHIVPRQNGGETHFNNLCFACHRCNEFKGALTTMVDPLTRQTTPLFHPRQQNWSEHFAWDITRIRLLGLTATGRVTIIALNMNNEIIVDSRKKWVQAGWHPPTIVNLQS